MNYEQLFTKCLIKEYRKLAAAKRRKAQEKARFEREFTRCLIAEYRKEEIVRQRKKRKAVSSKPSKKLTPAEKEEKQHTDVVDTFVAKLPAEQQVEFNKTYDRVMEKLTMAYAVKPDAIQEINKLPRTMTYFLNMRNTMRNTVREGDKLYTVADIFLNAGVENFKLLEKVDYMALNEDCYELVKFALEGIKRTITVPQQAVA